MSKLFGVVWFFCLLKEIIPNSTRISNNVLFYLGKVCDGNTKTLTRYCIIRHQSYLPNGSTIKTQMKSEQRKRTKIVPVRLTPAELKELDNLVDTTSAGSRSGYLRRVSLGQKVTSLVDKQVALEVRRLRGEMGKLGGLLKVAIKAGREHGMDRQYVDATEVLQDRIEAVNQKLDVLFGILVSDQAVALVMPLLEAVKTERRRP